jgi:hypothetical protein
VSQHKRARKERRRESRSIQRELGRSGAKARLETVKLALREPTFTTQLSDAFAWAEVTPSIRSADQIRDIALGVLASMGINTDGVDLKVSWYPATKQLDIRAVFKMETAQAAIDAAKAKAPKKPKRHAPDWEQL